MLVKRKQIRFLRLQKGLTQEEFAEKVEISKSKVSMIETGSIRRISETLLEKIAEVLDCNSDDLVEKVEPNTLEGCIKFYLDSLGIPEYLIGYQHIIDVLLLLDEGRGSVENLKHCYSIIINRNSYNTKTSTMNCTIRYAINQGFINTKNIALWDELFGRNTEPTCVKFFKISSMIHALKTKKEGSNGALGTATDAGASLGS